MLIFMSDGCGSGGASELASMVSAFSSTGLQVHTVAFGSADEATLRGFAAQCPGGKFHKAFGAADLVQAFREIAVESTLQSQLVTRFGSEISRLLTDKLVVDYL